MRAALYFAQDLLNRPSPLDEAAGISRERMRQYLLLAVLLHVWLVLMFGTAPGGAARPGEGAWGRLSVLLEGPVTSGSSTSAAVPDSGPPGQAPQQRFGGTVRPAESSRPQELPGAEKTDTWRALESANEAQLPDAARLTPLNTPQASEVPAVSTSELEQLKPISTARMSESTTRTELQRATSLAPAKLAPATRPVELPSMNVPSLDGLKPMSTATMAESTNRPDLQRSPNLAAPSKIAPSSSATDLSNLTAPSVEGVKPMSTSTLPAGSSSTSLETMPKAQELAAQKLPTTKMSEIGSAPAVDAVSPIAGSPAPGPGSRPPGGSPNAGAQQGHDVATAPSAPDNSKKPLNLNLPSRGPMAAGGGGSGILPLVPKPPDTKTAIEKAVKKGERPDCRNAYGGAGPLAVVPIIVDAVRDKGCKW